MVVLLENNPKRVFVVCYCNPSHQGCSVVVQLLPNPRHQQPKAVGCCCVQLSVLNGSDWVCLIVSAYVTFVLICDLLLVKLLLVMLVLALFVKWD